jgi:hypothetical protein
MALADSGVAIFLLFTSFCGSLLAFFLSFIGQLIGYNITLLIGSARSLIHSQLPITKIIPEMLIIQMKIAYHHIIYDGFNVFNSFEYGCTQSSPASSPAHYVFRTSTDYIPFLALFAIISSIPLALYFLSFLSLTVIYGTRRFLHVPLSYVVERLEEYPKGIFTVIAAIIASITAILTSIMHKS